MHLYLIQPKCLLLGGSHQALPMDAKNFLFLVAFMKEEEIGQQSSFWKLFWGQGHIVIALLVLLF